MKAMTMKQKVCRILLPSLCIQNFLTLQSWHTLIANISASGTIGIWISSTGILRGCGSKCPWGVAWVTRQTSIGRLIQSWVISS